MKLNRILVVDHSPETAQDINNILRNSGISVHASFCANSHDLNEALDQGRTDIAILCQPPEEELPLAAVIGRLQQIPQHIPIVIRRSLDDIEFIRQVLQYDIEAVVDSRSPDQLIRVVRRLLDQLAGNRELVGLKQRLDEIEHRYSLLLDSSKDAIAYLHEGLHIYANPAYMALLGDLQTSELEHTSILELFHFDPAAGDFKSLLRDMNQGMLPKSTITVSTLTGDAATEVSLEFSPARYNGERCIQLLVQPTIGSSELAEEIEKLRSIDTTTGLSNRSSFVQFLDQRIAEPDEADAMQAVLLLQPDQCKQLMQSVGASKSDLIIQDLAGVLQQCTGPKDHCARFGDYEFAVYVTREEKAGIEGVINNIIDEYQNHIIDLGEQSITNTCSMGLAYIGLQTDSAEEVLNRCHSALQDALDAGGNRFMRYRPKLSTVHSSDDDKNWVARIRHALNSDDVFVIHQPIVDLEQDSEPYHETSVYLREEERDLPPQEYLPVAERTSLAAAIDRHVLPALLTNLTDGGLADNVQTYLYNVSQNSVEDYSFTGWLQEQFKNHGLDGQRLILQLPDYCLNSNLKPAQKFITSLAETGCRFSINNFRPERKLLQALDHLPVQFIKLHQKLTNNFMKDSAVQEQMNQLAAIAKPKGIQVIAGEVTDAAGLANLWQNGVKLVQGDFLKEKSKVVGQ